MTARIDREILDVESRIARRRMSVELGTRAVWHRTLRTLMSPVGLLGAAAVGFLAISAARRPKHVPGYKAPHAGRWAGLASLAASAAFALLKAQFGSPAQMAQLVLSKVRKYQSSRSDTPH